MLIRAYRVRGHLIANLDPLGLDGEKHHAELDPATYGFTAEDYDREFFLDGVLGRETATLREALDVVKQTYCAKVGVEYMHIQYPDQKSWIQLQIESSRNRAELTDEVRRDILRELYSSEGFERFLHIKYPGTKRFFAGGRGEHDPHARGDHPPSRRARRRGDHPRHVAPRPASTC